MLFIAKKVAQCYNLRIAILENENNKTYEMTRLLFTQMQLKVTKILL